MSDPIPTYDAGETIRVWGRNLTNIDAGDVTSGATVDVVIEDEYHNELSADSGGVEDETNDWFCDVTLPDQPGMYLIYIEIAASEAVWKDNQKIYVSYAP
jgi:hypothetical protein